MMLNKYSFRIFCIVMYIAFIFQSWIPMWSGTEIEDFSLCFHVLFCIDTRLFVYSSTLEEFPCFIRELFLSLPCSIKKEG